MNYKINTASFTTIFVLFIALYSVLPFLVLSAYNHPSADDFVYSNIFIEKGFFAAQYSWYMTWSGRYTASTLLSLSPVSFYSFTGYKLASFFLLVLVGYAFFYLINRVFNKETRLNRVAISLLVLVLFLYQMPKIATGLYWGAGAMTYQLGNVFFLFMLGGLLKYLKTKNKKQILLVVFLLFFVIGSNETLMLLTNILLFFIVIFYYSKEQRFRWQYLKKNPFFLILLLAAIVFSLLVILAPGNDTRLRYLPNKHKTIAFYNTYMSMKQYLIQWFPAISVFSLLLLALIKRTDLIKKSWFSIHPIFSFFIVLILVYAGFFPAHWSMGVPPPLRTVNTIYFFFILSWLYFILSLHTYLKDKLFPNSVRYILMITSLVFLLKSNNIQTAYQDWFSGDAAQYDRELKARYKLIAKEKPLLTAQDTLRVPALIKTPKTLYFHDIETKASDWRNKAFAKYYELPHIVREKKK